MDSQALVVEDQDLMRRVLMKELRSVLREGAVHGAGTLEAAIALCNDNKFDLVLIDPGLPGVKGTSKSERLRVVEEIIDSAPEAIHIVVTGSDNKAEALACQQLGANAYVSKIGLDEDRFREIIAGIAESGFVESYSEVRALSPEVIYKGLTSREQEIIDFMRSQEPGMKRKAAYDSIGSRFGITPESAEKYFKRARAKLLRRGTFPKGT